MFCLLLWLRHLSWHDLNDFQNIEPRGPMINFPLRYTLFHCWLEAWLGDILPAWFHNIRLGDQMSLVGDDLTRLVRFRQLYPPNFSVRTTSSFQAHFFLQKSTPFFTREDEVQATSWPVIRNIATRPEMKVQEAGGIDRRFALLGLPNRKLVQKKTVSDSSSHYFLGG